MDSNGGSSDGRPSRDPPAIAKALAHPLRVRILEILSKGGMSASQFQRSVPNAPSLSTVSYHFRELAGCGVIEPIADVPRRGSVERIYRAVRPDRNLGWISMPVDEQGWRELSERLAQTFRDLETIRDEAAERLARADEEPIFVTTSLLGFESPPPSEGESQGPKRL